MNPADYGEIWRNLEEEAARRGTEGRSEMVRRLLIDRPSPELHLAVATDSGLLSLLIRMPESWSGDTGRLPRWFGMRAGVMVGTEKPVPRRFLVLRQEPGSPSPIFKTVAADLCDALVHDISGAVTPVITERLGLWKTFFEEVGASGLGPETQQGLFGELWVLRGQMIPRLGPDRALASWTGSKHTNHDFQVGGYAFEIKTSTAKQHQRVRIASERQLDSRGLKSLTLVVVSFSALEGGGETLPQLVHSLREAFLSNTQAARAFEEKLIGAGYIDAHSELYSTGYVLRSTRAFRVVDGFPRILEQDLVSGVGDVSYSVVLAACEPFAVEIEDVLAAVASLGDKVRT